jgi:hypothetical protein
VEAPSSLANLAEPAMPIEPVEGRFDKFSAHVGSSGREACPHGRKRLIHELMDSQRW